MGSDDMKIREGAYYRTRGGDVFGPMARTLLKGTKYVWRIGGDTSPYSWTEEGYWRLSHSDTFDLISEVYVSDTPPVVTETEEELREMMRDPRYWQKREPEWVKRVTDGFRVLVGGDTPPENAPAQEVETLRDKFAGVAIIGLLANPSLPSKSLKEWVGGAAYDAADAMMEAREK
jgi:hypothetical protein